MGAIANDEWMRWFWRFVVGWFVALLIASAILLAFGDTIYAVLG